MLRRKNRPTITTLLWTGIRSNLAVRTEGEQYPLALLFFPIAFLFSVALISHIPPPPPMYYYLLNLVRAQHAS